MFGHWPIMHRLVVGWCQMKFGLLTPPGLSLWNSKSPQKSCIVITIGIQLQCHHLYVIMVISEQ